MDGSGHANAASLHDQINEQQESITRAEQGIRHFQNVTATSTPDLDGCFRLTGNAQISEWRRLPRELMSRLNGE